MAGCGRSWRRWRRQPQNSCALKSEFVMHPAFGPTPAIQPLRGLRHDMNTNEWPGCGFVCFTNDCPTLPPCTSALRLSELSQVNAGKGRRRPDPVLSANKQLISTFRTQPALFIVGFNPSAFSIACTILFNTTPHPRWPLQESTTHCQASARRV